MLLPASAPFETLNNTSTRSRAFDLIRAVAIVRVCLWHGTGWAALTWIPALPVMFYLNGRFMAVGIEKHGARAAVFGRLRRIMYPYWAFAAVMLLVMYVYGSWQVGSLKNALSWIFPLNVPQGAAWQSGWITEPLWYVRTYLWLLLTSLILNPLVKRGKLPLIAAWIGAAWLATWVWGTQWWAIQNYVTFGACFVLGMFAATHRWRRTELFCIACVGAAGVALAAVAGLPAGGVVNDNHALHLSLGLILLAALEAVRPQLETALIGVKRWGAVAAVNMRGASIYLWHPVLIGVAYLGVGRVARGAILHVGALFVAAAMLWALLAVVGVVEDYAGHKTTSRAEFRAGAIRCSAGVLAAGLFIQITPGARQYDLPPVPSQAPPRFESYSPESSELGDALLSYPSETSSPSGWRPGVYAKPSNNKVGVDETGLPDPNTESNKDKTDGSDRHGSADMPGGTGGAPVLQTIPLWETLAEADDSAGAAVAAVVSKWVLDSKIGGIELAVLRPGVGRFEVSIDGDGNRSVMSDTVALASITKTFTAALLLRAYDDGLLDLHEPIGVLAEAPWFTMAKEITAGQLLGHRSGLVNYTETAAWKLDWRKMDGWRPALEAAMAEGFSGTPGSAVAYSSTNYIVAGLLAAQIYKMPVETLIETLLLKPLGLKTASVGEPIPGGPGTGTGNMYASVTDVARWGMALWRNQEVLGARGNEHLRNIDPLTMLGSGSFAWCPCNLSEDGLQWSSIGANGAEATVRYYPGIDLVVAMRIPGGMDVRGEKLLASIVNIVHKG